LVSDKGQGQGRAVEIYLFKNKAQAYDTSYDNERLRCGFLTFFSKNKKKSTEF
jgi:hypothetical protein